jgi:hypothetical protein
MPAEDMVEEEEPFPGTAPDNQPEEIPIDYEEPEEEFPLPGEEDEIPEAEIPGDEYPEEDSIFDEEIPEDFSAPDFPGPDLEEPDLSGEEDLIPDEEIPLISGEEPVVEDQPLSEEPPSFEEVPDAPVETENFSPEEISPEPDPEASVPAAQTASAAAPREKTEPPGLKKDDMLGLMNYLKQLAGSLPHKDHDTFMQSDARLSMEYIIDTLKGRRGLIREITARMPGTGAASAGRAAPLAAVPEAPVFPAPGGKMAALRAASDAAEAAEAALGKPKKQKKPDVAGMLAFMAKLAGALPDPGLGKAITRKVDTVITDIKHSGADAGEGHG